MNMRSVRLPRTFDSLVVGAALCTVAAGALMAVLAFVNGQVPMNYQANGSLVWLNTASYLLLAVGMAGLARSGALGRGRLAWLGTVLSIIGFAVLGVAQPLLVANESVANLVLGTAFFTATAGLIVDGAVVLRVRRWSGWHRFTPLVAGLFVLIVVNLSFGLPGNGFEFGIAGWGVCVVFLGIAMLAESSGQPQ